jgi:O-antigen biosynthesis protein
MKAVYFLSVWPEPWSSAAGVRSYQLIELFQKAGWDLLCVSSCSPNEALVRLETFAKAVHQPINVPLVSKELTDFSPDLIIYDRFILEEQFGWRARLLWPMAKEIIDTQDLHSLRRHRERQFLKANTPSVDKNVPIDDESWIRERQSFERVHWIWVVSRAEQDWLNEQGYLRSVYLPFSPQRAPQRGNFSDRKHFCFLGNLRHPPNLAALKWLKETLWPAVREEFPTLELHIWGAYSPQWISQLNKESGIKPKGHAENIREMLGQYLALVAPLPFGAGIKGKILEAWAAGTPVIGNEVAFEGFSNSDLSFTTVDQFKGFIRQMQEKENWEQESEKSFLATQEFIPPSIESLFTQALVDHPVLVRRAEGSFFFHAFRNRRLKAEEYFSRWIEEKNKGNSIISQS